VSDHDVIVIGAACLARTTLREQRYGRLDGTGVMELPKMTLTRARY
jgi:hypothetical protein